MPYLVLADHEGQIFASGVVKSTGALPPKIIRAAIAHFITDSRTVTPDVSLQQKSVFRVYAMLSPHEPARAKMDAWMKDESNPIRRAEHEVVSVEIKSVMQISQDTWQVQWKEHVSDRQGNTQSAVQMQAILTVSIAETTADTTEEQLSMNPTGLYVRHFAWSHVADD